MLRHWFSITASQRAARMRARRQAPSNPSCPKRRHGLFVALPPCANASRLSQAMMWRELGRRLTRRHRLGEVVRDLVEEAGGGQPALVGADQKREVLGHVAVLDGRDADLLQRLGELRQLRVVVELGAVGEARASRRRSTRSSWSRSPCPSGARGSAGSPCRGRLRLRRSCRRASAAPRSSGRASRSPAPPCRTARRRRSSCRPRRSRRTISAPRRPCRRSGGVRR